MKPVNLLPADVPVVAAEGAKPNMGMIGGAAIGVIAIIAVAGYFGMARVDTVKSEKLLADERAAKATTDAAAVRSQIESVGKPPVDQDKQLAQGAETVLVAAYGERYDYVLLARELRGIMDPGGWYESIEASSGSSESSSDDGPTVTITGYMQTKELLASFNERANSTRSLKNAETLMIESITLRAIDTRRPGVYFKFTMIADLVDTVAPYADASGSSGSSSTGTTVSEGGDEPLSLSLDAEPPAEVAAAAAPKAPAKPKNPFDVAASVAISGGTA